MGYTNSGYVVAILMAREWSGFTFVSSLCNADHMDVEPVYKKIPSFQARADRPPACRRCFICVCTLVERACETHGRTSQRRKLPGVGGECVMFKGSVRPSTFKPETKLPDFISSAVKCSFLSPWDPLNLAHDSFPKLAARNALSIRRESSLINAPSPGFYPPAYSTDCKWASGSRGEVMDAVAMPTEHLLITVPQKAPSPSSRPSDVAGSGKDR